MKYLSIAFVFISSILYSQQLTSNGMETIKATNDLSKKENYDKINTYIKDYVINENIEIIEYEKDEWMILKGKQGNVACYINTKMGSKTCFELRYTMQIKTYDNGFTIDITQFDAINEDMHPEKTYTDWFDPSGTPYPKYVNCIESTSSYFKAFKTDFIDFIETGDYW